MRGTRRRTVGIAGVAVAAAGTAALGAGSAPAQQAPVGGGAGVFGAPFVEPTIKGKPTAEKCVPKENPQFDRELDCKPTAGSLNTLPGGGFFYWDALEGTENVNANIVAEYGRSAENDQSRNLQLGANDTPTWTTPAVPDGGANPQGDPNTKPLIPGTVNEPGNDGALFCADQNYLPDGRILAAGGTEYLLDPGTPELPVGVTELAGITATRIYDPQTGTWGTTGRMSQGRWYPTLVTMGNGKMFVASGVEKLIKPVNDSGSSGGNVRETESFDPATGRWTQNPASANRSLPLFPRLHLLPNGHVLYNAGGQAFNPFGQDYAEAQWNVAAAFDPAKNTWQELGVPGLTTGVTTVPGFRGSTSSTMLPLEPGADGKYTKAQFLTAGGVPNPPSPGGYIAVPQSQIATVDTAANNKMTTEETGPLAQGRWYGSNVLLPTGEVITFSGADRDEVVGPGTELPVKRAELFDPKTKTWRPLAEAGQARTYHNSSVLMPDGRVLVGGHAPISTLYAKNITLAPGITGPNEGRDPTFEIYSPPYLNRGDRPVIQTVGAPGEPGIGGNGIVTSELGATMDVTVGGDASKIESVVLVRSPSQTHVIDGDQRSVVLNVVGRKGNTLTVALPESGNVLPPGPYMLFVNAKTPQGLVPSVSRTVFVGTDAPRVAGAAGRSTNATPCASAGGFTSSTATGAGRGLRLKFGSTSGKRVDVDVFQTSQGRSVVRERLVARFPGRKTAATWNGKVRGRAARPGTYIVRLRTTTGAGKPVFRRLALERRGGRWVTRPDHYRRVTCDLLRAYKLERPAFGGRSRAPLRVSYRLARPGSARIEVLRGGKVVRRVNRASQRANRTLRVAVPARGALARRGEYRVRITVTDASGKRLQATLGAKRL